MKPCVFTGSAVAIVTPFCGDGVDLEAFDRLIERQIQGGTDAIVVCGTTGEAATLSYNERMALIERCVRTVDRRVPVIAGSGTNSTASSIALSKAAQSAGVDALLTVTPYYNKASQSGLVPHFRASFGTALQCAKAVPSLGISDSYFSFMQYSSYIHFVFT